LPTCLRGGDLEGGRSEQEPALGRTGADCGDSPWLVIHPVFPMTSRWMESSFTDTMHGTLSLVWGLIVFAAVALSASHTGDGCGSIRL